jgi:hypothetical protein
MLISKGTNKSFKEERGRRKRTFHKCKKEKKKQLSQEIIYIRGVKE